MEKLKIGIVGLGRMGLTHAKNLKNNIPGAELIALCSDDGKSFELQKKWNIPYAYDSYEAMLENKEIDAVVIVTKTKTHPKNILQALEKEKHVFCEKPLGENIIECLELYKKAKKYPNQVLEIGFMRRFDKNYSEAKKMIDSGLIGKPFMIDAFSEDPEADIKNMISYGPYSGGQFIDVSAHDIDLMVWYFNSYPIRAFSLGKAYKYKEFKNWKDGDFVSSLVEFQNGEIGILKASRIGPQGYQAQMKITGTKGHLDINLIASKNGISTITKEGFQKTYHRNFNNFFAKAYINEIINFVTKIRNKDYAKNTLKSSIINIIAASAIQESFYRKEEIKIKYPSEINN